MMDHVRPRFCLFWAARLRDERHVWQIAARLSGPSWRPECLSKASQAQPHAQNRNEKQYPRASKRDYAHDRQFPANIVYYELHQSLPGEPFHRLNINARLSPFPETMNEIDD